MNQDIARQRDAINFLSSRNQAMLSLCPGYGKCRVSLLALPDDVGTLLIVCPTIVLLHWKAEVAKWRPGLGRVQILKSSKTKIDMSAQVYVVAYGVMTNRMKKDAAGLPHPDALIIDEFHALKTPFSSRRGKMKGQRTRAGFRLFKLARIGYLLSGTPILNRPSELGTCLQAMGKIRVLKNFQATYCGGWQAPWGWVKDGKKPDVEGIKEMLSDIMFRRPASDLKMITAGRLDPRILELDQPVDRREKQFSKKDILKNPNTIAFEGLSELMRLSGIKKVPLAVQHIRDVLDAEQSVVVFCWHTDVALELQAKLGSYGVTLVTGASKNTAEAAKEFQDGDDRVCVANIIAGGVGVNLFKSSYVIFVEAPWNPSLLDQCISRCDRVGQTEVVRTDILTVHKSVDAHVLHHIINKDEIIEPVITPTGVGGMSKEIFTGRDDALLRVVEFRAEDLDISAEDWLAGVMYRGVGADEKPEPKPAKKKVTKKAAAKPKAKPEPEPEPEVTLDQVRDAMRNHMAKNGSDATRALLMDDFMANKLTDVPAEDFAKLVDALTTGYGK